MNTILLNTISIDKNVIINKGSNNGGNGGEFKARYFDITEVPSDMILGVVLYSVAFKAQMRIMFTATVGVTEDTVKVINPEAVMWLEGVPLALSADEGFMMDSNFIESLKGIIAEQGGTLTEITKEEFYNFN